MLHIFQVCLLFVECETDSRKVSHQDSSELADHEVWLFEFVYFHELPSDTFFGGNSEHNGLDVSMK